MLGHMIYDVSPKLQRLFDTAQLTLGVRYAGSLPRTTSSHGLPLQDGSQGEERCSNVGETTVGGRELSVTGYSSEWGLTLRGRRWLTWS